MSRIGWTVTMWIAEAITARMRKGKPAAILVGAVCGGAAGALSPLPTLYWRAIAAILGGLTAATLAAMAFPRPARTLRVVDALGQDEDCGQVRSWWTRTAVEVVALTVVMERAIYSASQEHLEPNEILDALAKGRDPEVPGAALIRLRDVEFIEFASPDDLEITVQHRRGGRQRRRHVVFAIAADRQAFVEAVQELLGEPFAEEIAEVEWTRAILAPALCLGVAGLLTGGAAWLAFHWRAFPPPPPFGKSERDELVRLLMWAGPLNVMLAAALPLLLLVGWLARRCLHPPRVYRLTRASERTSRLDPNERSQTQAFKDIAAADASLERKQRRNERLIRWITRGQLVLIVVLAGLFLWACALALREYRAREDPMEADIRRMREAVRAGKTGEAGRRLFPEDHAIFLREQKAKKRAVDDSSANGDRP